MFLDCFSLALQKEGGFKLEDDKYKSRVQKLEADLVTAEYSSESLKAELMEAQSNTANLEAERDKLEKDYQRYVKGRPKLIRSQKENQIVHAKTF